MKRYKIILNVLGVCTLLFGVSSCLKDDAHFVDFAGVGATADIPTSTNSGSIIANKSFNIATAPTPYSFDVNISSPSIPTTSTDVTMGIDAATLKAYNDANLAADSSSTVYEILPDSTYSFASPTITVPAGQRLGTVTINFKTSKIDASHSYALPIVIKSATNGVTPSANWGKKLLLPKVKNPFEGQYHSIGIFNHPTAGPRKIDRDKYLQTTNANTVRTEFADLGSAATMDLTVNADNSVTLVPGGTANPNSILTAGKKSFYDPAAKAFTLFYQYHGASGDRVINEVITLQQ